MQMGQKDVCTKEKLFEHPMEVELNTKLLVIPLLSISRMLNLFKGENDGLKVGSRQKSLKIQLKNH